MASYKEIKKYINEKYGISIETCWIAHVKEICGLNVSQAPNRKNPKERVKPCPQEKEKYIKEAFRFYKMI